MGGGTTFDVNATILLSFDDKYYHLIYECRELSRLITSTNKSLH